MGTRPRVAVEVRSGDVVAARAGDATGLLASLFHEDLPHGAVRPNLKAGNIENRATVSAAVRRVLDGVSAKGTERSRYVTLVIPDTAVRVLLLDFDALPAKAAESLAVVRFRLKKLLPFDAEHAVVTYQVMSAGRDGVRVLAVAMPCDVLSEYEGLVTDAGYLPGAVLPSTLAILAGLEVGADETAASLLVNAGPGVVTTAIVQGGLLLLHRTVDLQTDSSEGDTLSALFPSEPHVGRGSGIGSAAEYDRMDAQTATQTQALRSHVRGTPPIEAEEAVRVLNATEPVSTGREITQAVSVAAAYFEDTLGGGAPRVVLAAGPLGAERLRAVLQMYGMEGTDVREVVDSAAMGQGSANGAIQRGLVAGVRGALKS